MAEIGTAWFLFHPQFAFSSQTNYLWRHQICGEGGSEARTKPLEVRTWTAYRDTSRSTLPREFWQFVFLCMPSWHAAYLAGWAPAATESATQTSNRVQNGLTRVPGWNVNAASIDDDSGSRGSLAVCSSERDPGGQGYYDGGRSPASQLPRGAVWRGRHVIQRCHADVAAYHSDLPAASRDQLQGDLQGAVAGRRRGEILSRCDPLSCGGAAVSFRRHTQQRDGTGLVEGGARAEGVEDSRGPARWCRGSHVGCDVSWLRRRSGLPRVSRASRHLQGALLNERIVLTCLTRHRNILGRMKNKASSLLSTSSLHLVSPHEVLFIL